MRKKTMIARRRAATLDHIHGRRFGQLACLVVAAATLAVPEARGDAVYSWGDNQQGQLGDGTQTDRPTPGPVIGLTGGVTAVSGGQGYGLAVQSGGAYTWGVDIYGVGPLTAVPVPGLSSGVTAVAGGSSHSLAVQNGAVYVWGYNGFGAFGNGTTSSGSGTPVAVNAPLTSGVTVIAAGNNFSMAVKNGGLYAWGFGYSLAPVAVSGLESGVTAITPNMAVQNGGLYFVSSSPGAPVPIPGLGSGVTAVAQGRYHSMAVRNGGVYAWGLNSAGQLGDGTTTEHDTPEQIDPADLRDIIAVAAGYSSSYALSSDGSLWDWGLNANGAMGLGNFQFDYLTPQHLLPPSGYRFTSIAGAPFGEDFAIATVAAVPEPGSLSVLALAAGSLFCRRRTTRNNVERIK
jgi:alpha-tubulin suppressor-like RCC1 family protein